MNNHFGKGLMAGLKATHADSAVNVTKFCADYKRGFVLGYSHRMYEKTRRRTATRTLRNSVCTASIRTVSPCARFLH
jgi:hypothetical protein